MAFLVLLVCVALYTSAWIEITVHSFRRCCQLRRTLHECVDWNFLLLSVAGLMPCRTLHECVDWNIRLAIRIPFFARRTLHECVDWNFPSFSANHHVITSHSIRVRGLKSSRSNWSDVHPTVALYTSAWIEICRCGFHTRDQLVALYTSAWIEIIFDLISFTVFSSRTLHECVDWNK